MSEIRVDTISEKTSANGVAIDSVTLKDGGATLTDNITFSASGKGVHLGVTTATASNLLDDYEEGIHTASITDSAGDVTSITLNSSFNQLSYTKVGRQVFVGGTLVISSFSGSWGSGQCQISLPFAVGDLTDRGGGVTGSIGAYSVDFTSPEESVKVAV